jgi:hypothetical protein
VTVGLGTNGSLGCEGVVPVSNESLKTSDTYALALDAANALRLTLSLLRTYTAANCGKRRGLRNDLVSALKVAFLDLPDEFGNMDLNGAAVNARHMLAVKAAVSLVDSGLLGITESNLAEVMCSYQRILVGHRVTGERHICLCHFTVPPF